MTKKSRPTQRKRQRELALQQKRQNKMARRLEKEAAGAAAGRTASGEDPDIAGIRPGPQPLPEEWAVLPPPPKTED